ncbi:MULTISPECIES: hypothetical protein [Gardnerella]|uniref:Uncharacterized protein n=1 Tax=Gardnerella vaginalis TaxID=2702 RepID=A0ABD4ZDB4_GARVA|nr:hypothetical protein [Gardnerella vaginalis]MDK6695666.1 hypothetical protein [Gardnerella vaginalis]MDK6861785.1 hypothetical protein [Gardnerella vaginalis]MDK8327885.1 hypothetical protein [Gardnerella vaginalis]MDK8337247.1 hypothetical protein [Gardnerella vaginalis]
MSDTTSHAATRDNPVFLPICALDIGHDEKICPKTIMRLLIRTSAGSCFLVTVIEGDRKQDKALSSVVPNMTLLKYRAVAAY